MTTSEQRPPRDRSVESVGRGGVASLFLGFGLFGGFVIVLGFVLALLEGTLEAEHPWPRLDPLVRDLSAFQSAGVIELGLVLLLSLPLVRNLSVLYVLIRRRQRRAALLAAFGLLAMLGLYVVLSLLSGPSIGT